MTWRHEIPWWALIRGGGGSRGTSGGLRPITGKLGPPVQLVIAEKPSVARDLARVLGVRGAGKHAIEGSARVITWCIGHLVELEEPAAYEPAWKAWRLDTLPMLPAAFKLRPVAGTRISCARCGSCCAIGASTRS